MLSDEQISDLFYESFQKNRTGDTVSIAERKDSHRDIYNTIRNATLEEMAKDIKFLMSFVDYLNVDDVPEGLDPTFYHTLTQSGDEKLAEQVKAIKQKYHLVSQMKEGE